MSFSRNIWKKAVIRQHRVGVASDFPERCRLRTPQNRKVQAQANLRTLGALFASWEALRMNETPLCMNDKLTPQKGRDDDDC